MQQRLQCGGQIIRWVQAFTVRVGHGVEERGCLPCDPGALYPGGGGIEPARVVEPAHGRIDRALQQDKEQRQQRCHERILLWGGLRHHEAWFTLASRATGESWD